MSEDIETSSDSVNRGPLRQPMWWLILAALSSWSYIAVWSANVDELTGFFPLHFSVWLLLLLAVGAAVQRAAFALLTGSSRLSSSFAVAAVVLILLQSWNSRVTAGLGLGMRLAVHIALIVVVAAIVVRLTPAFPHVRAVIGVLTVFLVGVPYLTLASETWSWLNPTSPRVAVAAPTGHVNRTPDVYVVVLDEYADPTTLRDAFDFDSTAFEASLAGQGLAVVSDAMSNYSNTLLSVAGLLEGRYPAIGGPDDTAYSDLVAVHGGENRLFNALDGIGYETHLFDNAWTFTRCDQNVDVCHAGGMNELDWLVAQRTPLFDLIPWLQLSPWIRTSVEQFDRATRLARSDAEEPRLVYLHALIPHAPLQLAADCSPTLPGLGSLEGVVDSPEARSAYRRQVQCVNKLVLDLVEAIPSDAIIFITGDHGVRWASAGLADPELNPETAALTLGVLTAYRFPASCDSVPEGASVQRSAAVLFDCLGIQPVSEPGYSALQPDRYFDQSLGRDGVYSITEVTQTVRGGQG